MKIFITLCIACIVIFIRSFGLFQSLELTALDEFFQLRPIEANQERITIIAIDEPSIRELGSPISDATLAQLLEKINTYQPRAIGLDVYRDLEVPPGSQKLKGSISIDTKFNRH